jgi:hypothetical protein
MRRSTRLSSASASCGWPRFASPWPRAEVEDNTASLAVAIQRTGCDVVQTRMSEIERHMQPLAKEIIAAPARLSAASERKRSCPVGGISDPRLP